VANALLASGKRYLKLLVAILLRYLGVYRLERLFLSRSGGLILAFHRVVREGEIGHSLDPQMYVTTSVFRGLLLFLHRHYDVVTLVDLAEKVESKAPRRKPLCALTFDDGYMDNYTNAFAILREMQMPATVFLTAGLIGTTRLLWNDAISIAFASISQSPRAKGQLRRLLSTGEASSTECRHWQRAIEDSSVRPIVEQLKTWPHAKIRALISKLEPYVISAGAQGNTCRMLTWSQVREMRAAGVSFGSHTLSHCILTVEDGQTVRREIQQSKSLIESKLGSPIDTLAYPNGEYNEKTIRIARQAGFRMALTLQKEYVSVRSNPMRLGRFLINQRDVASPAGHFSSALFGYEKSRFLLYTKRLVQGFLRGRSEKRT